MQSQNHARSSFPSHGHTRGGSPDRPPLPNARRRRAAVRIALVPALASALLLVGCGPRAAAKEISAFSAATTSTIDGVTGAFEKIDAAYVDTKTEEAILTISRGGVVDPATIIEPFLPTDVLAARIEVLESLAAYAELLGELTSDSSTAKLDAAVDGVAARLRSLSANETLVTALRRGQATPLVSDADIGLAATAFNEIARAIIDAKRTRAASDAVIAANTHVATVTELLRKDIGTDREVGLRGQLWSSYSKQITDRFSWIHGHMPRVDAPAPPGALSPNELREAIIAWVDLARDQMIADAALAQTHKALGTLATTHDALARSLQGPPIASIDELIAELREAGERIRTRYRALSASNPS